MEQYWPAITCLIAAAALTLAEYRAGSRGWRRAQWGLKPLASAIFVLQALMLGASQTAYGLAVLVALALSLIGDVLLIPRGQGRLFQVGVMAFLAGHLAYIAAFVIAGVALPGLAAGAAVMGIIAFAYWRYISARLAPAMKGQIGAYTAVICVMVITAFGAAGNVGAPTALLPVAALMFAVSDMMVGQDRFVRSAPWHALVITPLYFTAQVLFALSV